MWISSRIRSDSHTLTEAPFRVFQLNESNIRITDVKERDFVISVRALNESESEAMQLHQVHHVINTLLIALNVASFGSFYWYDDPWVHPVHTIADDFAGTNTRLQAMIVSSDTSHDELKAIDEQEIYNTVLIFGIVAREDTNVLVGEYCRGLLLLRMNFYDLNFRKEAFLCFYRALEHFVAVRILGVKRLKNELNDLMKGLKQLGASQISVNELREVYSIRCSQIAHSQGTQREITKDEVLKTKVFLDYVMHKTFKQQANEIISNRA